MTELSAARNRATRPPLLLRGFAPLVAALVLAALVVLLAPSIAPEVEVVRPGEPITTTSTTTPSTTSTAVPTEGTP
jgi:hypothetical protein